MQAATGFVYMGLICFLAALQIGMCTYIEAITMDLSLQFQHLNHFKQLQTKTKKCLNNAIELHSDMLKWVKPHFTAINVILHSVSM